MYDNNKVVINDLNEISSIPIDKLTRLQHLTFDYWFNQPLSNSFDKLSSLQHLTFGSKFNQPLFNSLDKLTSLQYLTFGWEFNQLLTNSLDELTSLQYLTFGCNFNKPLTNSLVKLSLSQHLTLGYRFNQPLDLPSNIKYLVLNCNNQSIIDNLHNNINACEIRKVYMIVISLTIILRNDLFLFKQIFCKFY